VAKKIVKNKVEVILHDMYFDLQDKNDILKLSRTLDEMVTAIHGKQLFEPFITFNVESDWDGYSYPTFDVRAYRWETDKEFDKRKERSKKSRAAALKRGKITRAKTAEKEKKLFLKLKAKYGEKETNK
jgi:hypothetical protein